MLGVTALGFFVLAANLSSWPSAAFSEPISQVAPAALARLQHDPSAMRTSFETMLALVSAVTVPVCLVESGSAAPLIRIVYGNHWLPAHQPLIWLALLAALQIFFQLTLDYFRAGPVADAHRPADRLGGSPGAEPDRGGQDAGGGRRCVRRVCRGGGPAASVVSRLAAPGAGWRGRSLAMRLGLPLLGAAAAGAAAAGVAAVAPSARRALPCGALAGLLVIGLLLLRMRSVLAHLAAAIQGIQPGRG